MEVHHITGCWGILNSKTVNLSCSVYLLINCKDTAPQVQSSAGSVQPPHIWYRYYNLEYLLIIILHLHSSSLKSVYDNTSTLVWKYWTCLNIWIFSRIFKELFLGVVLRLSGRTVLTLVTQVNHKRQQWASRKARIFTRHLQITTKYNWLIN